MLACELGWLALFAPACRPERPGRANANDLFPERKQPAISPGSCCSAARARSAWPSWPRSACPPAAEVILAGRDEQRLAAAGQGAAGQDPRATVRRCATTRWNRDSHQAFVDEHLRQGDVDLVISAAGVLIPQDDVGA